MISSVLFMSAPGSDPTPPRDRRAEVEAWWPLIARIVAFVFGAALLWQQANVPNPPGAQEWIVVAAIGCMGPTVATTVATIIDSLRGTKGVALPDKDPPA